MNTPRYAAAVAKLLRQDLPSGVEARGDQARGVATIERALRARTQRRRAMAAGGALAAAAALALVGSRFTTSPRLPDVANAAVAIDVTPSGQGAALAHNQVEEPLKTRVSIESGQRIDTPADGGASLQLSTGTAMTLAGRTSFRVDSQGATQRFSLQQGELVAHVAKLSAAQRFIVNTPDAEVEVRGTRFRLRVLESGEACGGGTRTRLEVTEGAVEVRGAGSGAVSIKAGEVWPADCSKPSERATPVASPPTPVRSLTAAKHDEPAGAHAPAPAPVTETERASALAAQNDLFAEGVARGRQGDTSGALRAYQELISRHPGSALAENALVERMRLLATSPQGAVEAKRYLARYPRGFAAGEARKLLAEP